MGRPGARKFRGGKSRRVEFVSEPLPATPAQDSHSGGWSSSVDRKQVNDYLPLPTSDLPPSPPTKTPPVPSSAPGTTVSSSSSPPDRGWSDGSLQAARLSESGRKLRASRQRGRGKKVRFAPHVASADVPSDVVCTLAATHCIIAGSVGVDTYRYRPLRIALDTGAGFNIIRRAALPYGWEACIDEQAQAPSLCDANGNPLQLGEVVWLHLRLGDATYRVNFIIADRLAVDVLVGTSFLNKHVLAIQCAKQRVRLRGETIPILGQNRERGVPRAQKGTAGEDEEDDVVNRKPTAPPPRDTNSGDRQTDRIRLAKGVVLEPYTQKSVCVSTKASGLVFIEPRARVQQRYQVRVANSLAEVEKDRPFQILLSNFSATERRLPKGMVVASAATNPLALVSFGGEIGRRIASCLNIVTDDVPDQPSRKNLVDSSLADATESDSVDWRSQVDLSHLTNEDLKQDIYRMMSCHESMWGGRLGEISVTSHNIDLVAGTRPIMQHPYRSGLRNREVIAEHVRKQLEAGVIEPAISEWASPVVLAAKKDGTLRFCVDFRRLNAVTIPDSYPLPRMDDCLDSLGNANVYHPGCEQRLLANSDCHRGPR